MVATANHTNAHNSRITNHIRPKQCCNTIHIRAILKNETKKIIETNRNIRKNNEQNNHNYFTNSSLLFWHRNHFINRENDGEKFFRN